MKPPRIYSAINAISRDIGRTGVAKASLNTDDGYAFRGIDDVVSALAPLLAKHRVCVLPRLSERYSENAEGGTRSKQHVAVKGAFDLVSAVDGSAHTVETFGEAIDQSDKATSKAMTAAYKYALIQTFSIPVRGFEDADGSSPKTIAVPAEPPQGWEAWAEDLISLIEGCETTEAIDRVAVTYGDLLRAMATAKRREYSAIGRAFAARRTGFVKPTPSPPAVGRNESASHAT